MIQHFIYPMAHGHREMNGKLFEKIRLAGNLHEVSELGGMRDENFGFRPIHTTSLQLACLFERIIRSLNEKLLRGADFLDVNQSFPTFWIYCLHYKKHS
jgi:hypothetical protein